MGVVDEEAKAEGSNIDEEEDNDEEIIVILNPVPFNLKKIEKKSNGDDMMLFEEKANTSGDDKSIFNFPN
jgi:hypothetical protein